MTEAKAKASFLPPEGGGGGRLPFTRGALCVPVLYGTVRYCTVRLGRGVAGQSPTPV
jgi:hypothetical protein